MKLCLKCNYQNRDEATVCEDCGNTLIGKTNPNSSYQPNPKPKKIAPTYQYTQSSHIHIAEIITRIILILSIVSAVLLIATSYQKVAIPGYTYLTDNQLNWAQIFAGIIVLGSGFVYWTVAKLIIGVAECQEIIAQIQVIKINKQLLKESENE